MHFLSRFGDSSLNRWQVIVRTSSKWVKFDFQVKFYLEVQDRSPPKMIGILTKVFCTYVSNLVILAWTVDELSCGQASDWYTHRHTLTDTQTWAMTIPEGQNWPRVKNKKAPLLHYIKHCASFQSHWWIQTGVTVRKRSIQIKIDDFFSRVTFQFDVWPWKTIGHLFYATSSLCIIA